MIRFRSPYRFIPAFLAGLLAVGCASTTPYTQKLETSTATDAGTSSTDTAAERALRERIARDPGDFNAWYDLGVLYERRGAIDQAEQAWRKVQLLEPRHIPAAVNLAALYKARGQIREAIVTLNDLFDTGMDDPQARTDLAILYRLSGNADRSLYESSEVLKRFGLVYGAMLNAGLVYLDTGRTEMALTLFLELKNQYPDDAGLHFSIGKAYQALGNPIAAEKEYQQAISLDTNAYEAYNNIGVLRLLKKEYAAALTQFERAVSANVNFATGWLNRGIALRGLERYREAEQSWKRALSIRPDFPEAEYNLALLYDDYWNRPDNAITAWRAYLKRYGKTLPEDEVKRIEDRIAALLERKEKLRAEAEQEPEPEPEPEPAPEPATTPAAPAAMTTPDAATATTPPAPVSTPAEASAPEEQPEPAATTSSEPDYAEIAEAFNQARQDAGLPPVEPTRLIEQLANKAAELQQKSGKAWTFEVQTDGDKPKLVPKALE
ncbi:MAG: hypothetical protein D6761_04830 [Candidatus Dadabacteria bacterium]|nr:MAG: hypothetical protein D6761_04830 [Candidatus Dadabacteria bacterium]